MDREDDIHAIFKRDEDTKVTKNNGCRSKPSSLDPILGLFILPSPLTIWCALSWALSIKLMIYQHVASLPQLMHSSLWVIKLCDPFVL